VWTLVQAAYTQSILEKSLYAYTVYSAALTPVILAAFFSKRATAAGAVSAIAAGTLVTVFWDAEFVHRHLPTVLAQREALFPALLAAVLCLVVVSAFTRPPREEQLAQFRA
jgi:SSS family solute:Na+ symporter/sodium/proline symporter